MLDAKQIEVQFVTNAAGEKTGVLMAIKEFESLLEDIEDLAAVAERRHEPTISQAELIAELRRDGII